MTLTQIQIGQTLFDYILQKEVTVVAVDKNFGYIKCTYYDVQELNPPKIYIDDNGNETLISGIKQEQKRYYKLDGSYVSSGEKGIVTLFSLQEINGDVIVNLRHNNKIKFKI